ncbi:TRAP transporter small permease [Alloalcanivorax xenomutans]|jgi:TRAP-type C4-dicarboxylate transport system permease small subunit|uniref:TRAP transporter small permease protein n=1 Tax=Alloalcanivorax xenomutans TaxID=1094342 RepID=A0A9Q3W329_9GAMM|nr:TRAP transporter small permease [Alloalcanivorax xenomutans]ERS14218.1 C4-dicarboxylate ABC transporter permease [Alcanivorax sp. PN-3]MBA4722311.1 TRAP transporter small permease [Alcanivorax sp.]ARB47351.1 C4-dicarboxylate ABC transporter permease [Alloalcanivorax xenomutans]MCE7508376.1 TRAP transporter small permease [Alloalcanivorax xenomutans]MCE7525579.1 TRAP transporter small permease [Alloalcanivorax xenomutans]
MYRYLEAGSKHLAAVTAALGAASALIMTLALLAGVFCRYVLNSSLSWSDEVALLAFSWTVFLFASVLTREFGHVRVSIVVDALPGLPRHLLERGSVILILLFGGLMLWAGWQFTAFTAHQVSPALRYPLWLQGAAVPASGALIVFHALVLLFRPGQLGEHGGAVDE